MSPTIENWIEYIYSDHQVFYDWASKYRTPYRQVNNPGQWATVDMVIPMDEPNLFWGEAHRIIEKLRVSQNVHDILKMYTGPVSIQTIIRVNETRYLVYYLTSMIFCWAPNFALVDSDDVVRKIDLNRGDDGSEIWISEDGKKILINEYFNGGNVGIVEIVPPWDDSDIVYHIEDCDTAQDLHIQKMEKRY